jgi:hypothetical protein
VLIAKGIIDSLSALQCARSELFAKSSNVIENKEDGS